MILFKPEDLVVRTTNDFSKLKIGRTYIVEKGGLPCLGCIKSNHSPGQLLKLRGYSTIYCSCKFTRYIDYTRGYNKCLDQTT